ncbi:MAG: SAM-dependent methyltransferase [Pirellula sp.]|nr:SAM-dependent methyltransferase [Pirellula sp.]
MTVADVADYRWLVGEEAAEVFAAHADVADPLALVARLRKSLTAARAALVAEQIGLRRRAVAKFPDAARMFFTPVGLEQATDFVTARYKAQRFPVSGRYVDLCCGIGGDLIALGARGETVGYDRDPTIALFAEANARASSTAVVAESAASAHVAEAGAWHIDPDRRPQGRRTTQLELHEPSLESLEQMLAANGNAAMKLAPGSAPPEAWQARAECEWISRAGECKQMVLWFGTLAAEIGTRRATLLTADGTAHGITGAPDDLAHPDAYEQVAADFGRYLFEPDAAVLAAHLTESTARRFSISPLHVGSAYLTGDVPLLDPLLATFEILEPLPLDVRKLRAWFAERNVGRLEIKKRGVDVEPEKLRRELKLSGDESGCLILVRRGDRVTALAARRLVAPA